MIATQVFAHYRAVDHIEGWLSCEAALVIGLIDELQKQRGVCEGGIFEIGVHHGRSALFLAHLLQRPQEHLAVCDIFNPQENTSHSGLGDRERFMSHAQAAFGDLSFLRVYAQPSSSLTTEIMGTGYRLVHIDGGHSAAECLADLHLAADHLVPEGMIVLDDPFRIEWPGVTEALLAFLQADGQPFVPLVGGFNKIVLMRTGAVAPYAEAMTPAGLAARYFPPPWCITRVELLGRPYTAIVASVANDDLSCRAIRNRWMLRRALRRAVRGR
jgi:hypothetical protein